VVCSCGLGSCLAGGSSFFLCVFLLLYFFFFFCFSFFGLLVLCSSIVFLLPSSLFLILSKCSPFCLLVFFFKIFLSPKPLYFSTLKKNLCSSLFPTNNLLIPLLVRLYFPFFSLFFLFISTKKKSPFFFLFGSPFVFIGGRGRGSPYPAQAQGKVAGAWLAFLFYYGDRVKGIWVVLGG